MTSILPHLSNTNFHLASQVFLCSPYPPKHSASEWGGISTISFLGIRPYVSYLSRILRFLATYYAYFWGKKITTKQLGEKFNRHLAILYSSRLLACILFYVHFGKMYLKNPNRDAMIFCKITQIQKNTRQINFALFTRLTQNGP